MQDLRDKLVKAGLASKKQAREARAESRKKRKAKGGARQDARQDERKVEQFKARQTEQTARVQQRQEELNRGLAAKEAVNRIRNVIRTNALAYQPAKNQDRPFYFMGNDRRIRKLMVSFELAHQLSEGEVAITEADFDPNRDFVLVEASTARRLEELERPGYILFWNKPGESGESDLPTYGSGR